MEYEKIKQLMEDFGNSKLSKIEIDFPDGTKINMKKADVAEKVVVTNTAVVAEEKEQGIVVREEKQEELSGKIIKSPMVGTFYLKPSPTAAPFVEIGKTIKTGDTLCIIEAMKLMNEIESEYDGKVSKILIKDGEPVEYGTPLFVIE